MFRGTLTAQLLIVVSTLMWCLGHERRRSIQHYVTQTTHTSASSLDILLGRQGALKFIDDYTYLAVAHIVSA